MMANGIRLWTPAFWAWRREWGLVPVQISVGLPKDWRWPEHPLDDGRLLAPFGRDKFEPAYLVRMEKVGLEGMQRTFAQIAARHPDAQGLALLCYEGVLSSGWCHRRLFAMWWEEVTASRSRSTRSPRETAVSEPARPRDRAGPGRTARARTLIGPR